MIGPLSDANLLNQDFRYFAIHHELVPNHSVTLTNNYSFRLNHRFLFGYLLTFHLYFVHLLSVKVTPQVRILFPAMLQLHIFTTFGQEF